jgi:hypothetical protein
MGARSAVLMRAPVRDARRDLAASVPTKARTPVMGGPTRTAAPRSAAAIPAHDSSEGNRAAGAPRIAVQRKLAVGAVDDPLEHEANRVADEVMRMPEPAATPMLSSPALLHRKCACAGSGKPCAACSAEQKNVLQRKTTGPVTPTEAPPIVHQVLASPGQPLDAATRAFFEPRFGYDFSGVRVHADARARQSAESVDAQAYAVGNDIVFGAESPPAGSRAGRVLMARELIHVVQQDGRPRAVQRQPTGATGGVEPDEPLEVALEREERSEAIAAENKKLGEILERIEEQQIEQEEKEDPFFVRENPRLVQLRAQLNEEKKRLPEELQKRWIKEAKSLLKAQDQLSVLDDELKRLENNRKLLERSVPDAVAAMETMLKAGRAEAEKDVEKRLESIKAISQYIEAQKDYFAEKEQYLRKMREQLKLQGLGAARKAGVTTEMAVPEEPAALLQTTTLLQTMIEASRLLAPYVSGKRAVNLRVPAKFKVDGPYAFTAAKEAAHLSPFEAGIGGFYDRVRDEIHLPQKAHFAEALHEAIHKYSVPHLRNMCHTLNEGVTQYFADAVLQEQGLPKAGRVTYQDYVDCAIKLMRQFGFDNVARFYFLGIFGPQRLTDAVLRCDKYCD